MGRPFFGRYLAKEQDCGQCGDQPEKGNTKVGVLGQVAQAGQ